MAELQARTSSTNTVKRPYTTVKGAPAPPHRHDPRLARESDRSGDSPAKTPSQWPGLADNLGFRSTDSAVLI